MKQHSLDILLHNTPSCYTFTIPCPFSPSSILAPINVSERKARFPIVVNGELLFTLAQDEQTSPTQRAEPSRGDPAQSLPLPCAPAAPSGANAAAKIASPTHTFPPSTDKETPWEGSWHPELAPGDPLNPHFWHLGRTLLLSSWGLVCASGLLFSRVTKVEEFRPSRQSQLPEAVKWWSCHGRNGLSFSTGWDHNRAVTQMEEKAGDQLFPGVAMKEQAQGSCVTGPFSLPILPFYTHFPNQNEHKTGRTQLLWDISVCILLPVGPGHPMPLTWLVDQALGALNSDRRRSRAENAATAQFLGVTCTLAVSVIAKKARHKLECYLTHLCTA